VKLRIEVSDGLPEDEVVIRCGRVDETVQKLQEYVLSLSMPGITFYEGTQEYYLPVDEVLFFETDGEQIYGHFTNNAFKVKYKLYELEKMLPHSFIRAAKGTIVNTSRIYSINRNLTSSSQIRFVGTHKHIYVSRHYYNALKEKMNERSARIWQEM